jgi:hypothetical protein
VQLQGLGLWGRWLVEAGLLHVLFRTPPSLLPAGHLIPIPHAHDPRTSLCLLFYLWLVLGPQKPPPQGTQAKPKIGPRWLASTGLVGDVELSCHSGP